MARGYYDQVTKKRRQMASFVPNPAISMIKEGPIFHLQDLARMRHAYDKACHDGTMPQSSDSERASLAKAIVSSYRSGLTEQELVLAARKVENRAARTDG